jgi:hypothetical protein
MNKMPAITGWAWLKQGARLFRKQPAALTMLLFANILISLTIGGVPVLGPLLAVVLIPSFSVAFMRACLMIENGKRVTPGVLLSGFRKPAIGPLCKIGLIYLGVSVVLALLGKLLVDSSFFWQQVSSGKQVDPKEVQFAASDMIGMLGIILLELAAVMSLSFAAPLTFWQKMKAGKATFYSFFAVIKSARVFLVLLLAWFGLFFGVCFVVALVFGAADMGRVVLMWIVFLFVLLLQCAMYAGYREIFGKPDDPEARPA